MGTSVPDIPKCRVFVCEMVTYLAADGRDRVLVMEPEQVLEATIRFCDRAKKHFPG
jgi:hypothetical protein